MLSLLILCSVFFLSSGSTAAVLPPPSNTSDIAADVTHIQADEVLIFGSGNRVEIMKESEWQEMVEKDNLFSFDGGFNKDIIAAAVNSTLPESPAPYGPHIEGRCDQSTEVQILETIYFDNWDVAMSGVIQATSSNPPGPGNAIAVTSGYSLANALTVGSTTTVTLVAAILTTAVQFQYQRTWTTTYTAAYTFTVTSLNYGLVISNPYTRRVSGNTLSGCTGSWNTEYFQADSYTSASQSGLSWVQGVIRLCQSPSYPVPYCVGNGVHR
ncbi:hypothetical protein ACEPPN_013174 [Leptodophora sp. 'Broadleaf-Isolate-01']